MKNFFYNLWNKTKIQPDLWFFFIFLLTFSLGIRKVLFYFPIKETFNEYSGVYIYISDIALIFTIILWLISILHNNNLSLSSIKLWIKRVLKDKYLIIPLFFAFISFLSILWSENKSIALFRSIKILEFYLLYIYIIFRISPELFHACPPENCSMPVRQKIVPRGTIWGGWNNLGRMEHSWEGGTINIFSLIIIFLGLFQGVIGIFQFFIQKSIGLFWLRESLISPEILGVAKIILNKETYIRAYGLMPHPNILGGFLLFSIIFTLLYKKLLHACPKQECSTPARSENVPRGTFLDEWNILGRVEQFHLKNTSILNIALFIQIIALFLTFSKSAIIGLIIALLYIYTLLSFRRRRTGDEVKFFHACPPENCSTPVRQKIVTRGTTWGGWNILGRVEHSKALFLSGLIILVFFFLIIKPDLKSLFFNSLKERSIGYKTVLNIEMSKSCLSEENCSMPVRQKIVPRGTIWGGWNNSFIYPVLGVGAGQSVLVMQKFYPQNLQFWEYQPVHNVFLLILSELGVVGLILFIWWFWKLFHACPPENCSTWNNLGRMEHSWEGGTSHSSSPLQGEELKEGLKTKENSSNILCNNKDSLSSIIFCRYFKAILLGLIFIMLFDHYLWDIQQGSLLLWITAGFVAGIIKINQKIK